MQVSLGTPALTTGPTSYENDDGSTTYYQPNGDAMTIGPARLVQRGRR